ncbi:MULTISPECIES: VOC family protein [Oceanobacillus]|uniref:VOC family protein n=2 Tax=Oceanobacillus TaxID=182709 RepID=A0ABV9K0N0_9BACI|nr:VOC family protein [Oceanobacillus oncorhynchi]MDM8101898.1 VOC family protein [Oceanobacillus oncorhynchi]UUI42077.1 VOC family protein [Oceanobacillus oncorhynchi]
MTDFRIEKLNTIVVPVKDLDRSIAFYKDILHLEQGFTDQSMAFISAGTSEHDTTILLHIIDEPEPVEKGMVIEFLVNDVSSAVSSLRNRNVKIIQDPIERPWGVKEAVIADPDGYRIWIVETIYRG